MSYPLVFLKLRSIAFACITLINLLWIILLSILAFYQWDVFGHPEQSFVALLLCISVITVIMIPILILREFRPWLDGARLLFLILAHVGSATLFASWYNRLVCPTSPDQQGECQLFKCYILIASWVTPALLIVYSCGLTIMVYRRSKLPPSDPENVAETKSELDTSNQSCSDSEPGSEVISSVRHQHASHLFSAAPIRTSQQSGRSRSNINTSLVLDITKSRFSSSTAGRVSGRMSKAPLPLSHHSAYAT